MDEEAEEYIPEATPATPDLICWLWAACEPYRGHLNISEVARQLHRGRDTVRRWLHEARGRVRDDELLAQLEKLAIARGKGEFWWPTLDEGTARRLRGEAANAKTAHAAIAAGTYPEAWDENGTTGEHEVLLVRWPDAQVFGINTTMIATLGHDDHRQKLERRAEIIQTVHAPNKYAALLIKHHLLTRKAEHRCIAPAGLVKFGRTETWREAGRSGRLADSVNRVIKG